MEGLFLYPSQKGGDNVGNIMMNGRPYGGAATAVDADHLIVTDGVGDQVSAQTMAEHILGDFGNVVSSSIADRAYTAGEYIVLGSYFYKVTDDVASGASFIEGTNIERTSVGAEVSELNSNQVKTKIVTTDFGAGTWVSVPKPEGARAILSLNIVSRSATNGYWLLWEEEETGISVLRINTSGTNLVILNAASTNTQIKVTYI